MIKVILAVIFIWIVLMQVTARFGYKFCRKDSTKECRNLTCSKGKECKRNSLYCQEKK